MPHSFCPTHGLPVVRSACACACATVSHTRLPADETNPQSKETIKAKMHQYISRVEVLKGINALRPGPEPEPEPELQPRPRERLLTPLTTNRFAGDSAASWTFDNDGPSFQAMSESIAQQLEAAYKQRKPAITVQTPHGEYRYDLQRLTQVNTATGRVRNIRRTEMHSPAPSPRPAASEVYLPAGDLFPAPRTWTHQPRTQNCVLEQVCSLNPSVCTHSTSSVDVSRGPCWGAGVA